MDNLIKNSQNRLWDGRPVWDLWYEVHEWQVNTWKVNIKYQGE